ncbi:MAG: hypothetical protein SGJ04_08500 [Bacteroidota bacterium]|nr:hypothetical protein [Bacteroidota bacterium]
MKYILFIFITLTSFCTYAQSNTKPDNGDKLDSSLTTYFSSTDMFKMMINPTVYEAPMTGNDVVSTIDYKFIVNSDGKVLDINIKTTGYFNAYAKEVAKKMIIEWGKKNTIRPKKKEFYIQTYRCVRFSHKTIDFNNYKDEVEVNGCN